MNSPPEKNDSKSPAPQEAERTKLDGTGALRDALIQARKEGFTMTPTDHERLRLRAIPGRLADRLSQMHDATEIAEVLLAAINEALDDSKR